MPCTTLTSNEARVRLSCAVEVGYCMDTTNLDNGQDPTEANLAPAGGLSFSLDETYDFPCASGFVPTNGMSLISTCIGGDYNEGKWTAVSCSRLLLSFFLSFFRYFFLSLFPFSSFICTFHYAFAFRSRDTKSSRSMCVFCVFLRILHLHLHLQSACM